MRSKARIVDHPIHPMLIPLPIACAIGTIVCDMVARTGYYPEWYFMGYVLTLGTWATGLLAAVPGLIDYLSIIPSKTKAKKVATLHLALNVTVVGFYFISWLLKNATGGPSPATGSLILEIVAGGMLVVSGWLGGTLVYRHRAGVSDDARPLERTDRRDRHAA